MTTVQQLRTDLHSLLSESKRRNTGVRNACEEAIASLGSFRLDEQLSNEITEDMKKKLLRPFILSSHNWNAKTATISIPIIHKLIISNAVSREDLEQLLHALKEASNLALDIQLRILQCLPSLVQNYGKCFTHELIGSLLGICVSLTSTNKSNVVINTASATLQQIISNMFSQIDELTEPKHEVSPEDDVKFRISDLQLDCYSTLFDLCNVIESTSPKYFDAMINLSVASALEIIENIISNHQEAFDSHDELAYLSRVQLVPSLLRILNVPNKSFPITIRILRTIYVLLTYQLDILEIEGEIVISFLNHMLLSNDSEASDVTDWKSLAVLEVMKGIIGNFRLLRSIHEKYDHNPKKKNVVQEIFKVLHTFSVYHLHGSSDVLVLPQVASSSQMSSTSFLSKELSDMKLPILDHLDKTEVPSSIPQTYSLYLVFSILSLYGDGLSSYVGAMNTITDSKILNDQVESVSELMTSSNDDIRSMLKGLMYSSCDNDVFHRVIRVIQKLAHAAGILGANTIKDEYINLLAYAIIKNVSTKESSSNPESRHLLQDQGRHLLSLGESVMESFTSQKSHHESNDSTDFRLSRSFNYRQAICLRALTNIAISLGSTLLGSWKTILLTFQWCDYFLNGADELGGSFLLKKSNELSHDMSPTLSNHEIMLVESFQRKFIENIHNYSLSSYETLLESLMDLFKESLHGKDERNTNSAAKHLVLEFDNSDYSYYLNICPYNKTYFLKCILSVCHVDPVKFLIENDKAWSYFLEFFSDFITERGSKVSGELRIQFVQIYCDIIKNSADCGFKSEEKSINNLTAKKTLDALVKPLKTLFSIGVPSELLVFNCETEIHLRILTSLHELIDKYDTYYQDSWHTVFEIINTCFRSENKDILSDNNLHEKIRLLIDSSFNTLKLILDEFTSSLPFDQLKILTDTLYMFIDQRYDLNLSFSAVSYFWLIGDALKYRILTKTEEEKTEKVLQLNELNRTIEEDANDSKYYYELLDVYILFTLSKVCMDSRPRVRDGAIQTFFQIFEVHGDLIHHSWELMYNVIFENIFKMDLSNEDFKENKNEWTESLILILSGFVSIYGKFLTNFSGKDGHGVLFKCWSGLVNYLKEISNLKWIKLNLELFKAFHDLLIPLESVPQEEIRDIRELLLDFLLNFPIEYDFVHLQYQSILINFIHCFPLLLQPMNRYLSVDQATKILYLFNKCARYPVLREHESDKVKLSSLQCAVLENMEMLELSNPQILALIIQQLSNFLVFPFAVRLRIENKLNPVLNGKMKIPSFIAISHQSLHLLRKRLEALLDYTILIQEKQLVKAIRSLLEVIQTKFEGITSEGTKPLWVDSQDLLLYITKNIMGHFYGTFSEDGNAADTWKLILKGINNCYEVEYDSSYEEYSQEQYEALTSIVLPRLILSADNKGLVEDFIKSLYLNSFLYAIDDEEKWVLDLSVYTGLVDMAHSALALNEFYGCTKPLLVFSNKKSRIMCLKELIKFSLGKNYALEMLVDASSRYFLQRTALTLHCFIEEQLLVLNAPISKIQEEELTISLQGLSDLQSRSQAPSVASSAIRYLYPLLTKAVPYTGKSSKLHALLLHVLQDFRFPDPQGM